MYSSCTTITWNIKIFHKILHISMSDTASNYFDWLSTRIDVETRCKPISFSIKHSCKSISKQDINLYRVRYHCTERRISLYAVTFITVQRVMNKWTDGYHSTQRQIQRPNVTVERQISPYTVSSDIELTFCWSSWRSSNSTVCLSSGVRRSSGQAVSNTSVTWRHASSACCLVYSSCRILFRRTTCCRIFSTS